MIMLKSDTQRAGIDKPESIPVPEYIAGHLLWEAMGEFRAAYANLTEACYIGADQMEASDIADSVAISTFITTALPQINRLGEALKRANLFYDGEVYDELIERNKLAPRKATAA